MWFLPPDPNNKMEFWLLVALSNMALRITSPWGLVGIALVIYVLVCLVLATLLMRVLGREIAILSRRLLGRSREARVLQVAVGLLVVCWGGAWWLGTGLESPQYGRYLFAWSSMLFMATVEMVEVRARRREPHAEPGHIPADVSLTDLVSWQKTVKNAQAAK